MAKEAREFVWLECTSCKQRNYRAERRMKGDTGGKQKKGPPACMDGSNRLSMNKFCAFERKHTIHVEARKK